MSYKKNPSSIKIQNFPKPKQSETNKKWKIKQRNGVNSETTIVRVIMFNNNNKKYATAAAATATVKMDSNCAAVKYTTVKC